MTTLGPPCAGLVPFYLQLYDETLPQLRTGFDDFLARVRAGFESRGITMAQAPICRVAAEFESAVNQLEKDGADCLITLHLAYSPSLEAIGAFCRTRLPIVVLDTTMDPDFGRGVSPDRILYNHGVHGVMDFASMLRRRRRHFEIVAGAVDDPRTLDGAAALVHAARAARRFRATRALRVGTAFAGMGDFAVDEDVMAATLGIRAQQVGVEELDRAVLAVSDDDVVSEVASDNATFACELPEEVHARSVRVGLGLRSLIEAGAYNALSVNFQIFDRSDRPSDTMPFLEISKAMARGVGYAGEGDVLTAALVGALAQGFGAVTFTEVFCPDWAGDSLFLSHMGEISPAVCAGQPRIFEKPFVFGGARNPAVLTGAVKPGPAVFVNLAPGPDNTFTLIVAKADVLDDATHPQMRDTVRAWMRPRGGVEAFLAAYSRLGGTHHSALVLGDLAEALAAFGRFAGLDVVEWPRGEKPAAPPASRPQLQMVWPESRLPEPPPINVPTGYVLRRLTAADDEGYLRLMHAAGFSDWTAATLANAKRQVLPDGLFVIEHSATGRLAATAMATHNPTEQQPSGGELGWLAVAPEHRGKRLGEAVCSAVVAHHLRLGYRRIYLRTDDFRLPAIRIYLRMGFEPVEDGPEMRSRWKAVQTTLAADRRNRPRAGANRKSDRRKWKVRRA